jgi:hypothetical protein
MRWLVVVARRVMTDCIRAHPDYVDRRRAAAAAQGPPGFWIRTTSMPRDGLPAPAQADEHARVAAGQLMRYATAVLPDRQRRALEMWAFAGRRPGDRLRPGLDPSPCPAARARRAAPFPPG